MIKKRIIFTFYFYNGYFVQSRNFDIQKVGDLKWIKTNFDLEKISNFIDEVAIINISSEDYREKFLFNLKEISKNFLIPIIAGGKIKTIDDVNSYFKNGCDKVIINSIIHKNPNIINEISKIYGSQSIVASVDLKKVENNYLIFTENGKKKIKTEPKKVIKEICEMNIGEILLRSIDKDGSGQGLDFNLLNFIPDDSLKNVILSGGIGNTLHIENGLKNENVNAVCTGNLFNFINDELKNTREILLNKNFNLPSWNHLELKSYKKKFEKFSKNEKIN